jgi:hypothetical protein
MIVVCRTYGQANRGICGLTISVRQAAAAMCCVCWFQQSTVPAAATAVHAAWVFTLPLLLLQYCCCGARFARRFTHQPVPYLQHTPHARLKGFAHVLALLRLQHLVICCLQLAEYLQVLYVDAGPL